MSLHEEEDWDLPPASSLKRGIAWALLLFVLCALLGSTLGWTAREWATRGTFLQEKK